MLLMHTHPAEWVANDCLYTLPPSSVPLQTFCSLPSSTALCPFNSLPLCSSHSPPPNPRLSTSIFCSKCLYTGIKSWWQMFTVKQISQIAAFPMSGDQVWLSFLSCDWSASFSWGRCWKKNSDYEHLWFVSRDDHLFNSNRRWRCNAVMNYRFGSIQWTHNKNNHLLQPVVSFCLWTKWVSSTEGHFY